MNAATIKDRLTAAECERIAERFVDAMSAQADGRTRGAATAAVLVELWEDIQEWTSATQNVSVKEAA